MHHPSSSSARARVRHSKFSSWLLASLVASSIVVVAACSSDDETTTTAPATPPRGNEAAGQMCKAATECYPGLEGGALKGAAVCLDRVTNGYCTHLCNTDADCCAVPGECKTGFKQVCSPFESTGQNMCFLSCEDGDLHSAPDAGTSGPVLESTAYCQTYAASEFGCRSSGGGKANRKVCVPGGSAADAGPG